MALGAAGGAGAAAPPLTVAVAAGVCWAARGLPTTLDGCGWGLSEEAARGVVAEWSRRASVCAKLPAMRYAAVRNAWRTGRDLHAAGGRGLLRRQRGAAAWMGAGTL